MRIAKELKLTNKSFYLYLAMAIFILIRFDMISKIWHGRMVPPDPDDSYHYFYHIKWMASYGLGKIPPLVVAWKEMLLQSASYEDIRSMLSLIQPYFGWTWPLGLIVRWTSLPVSTVYHYSFYGGVIVSLGLLLMAFKEFRLSEKVSLLIILSVYSGSGSYHGFFWVVPSFYMLCTYFCLWGHFCLRDPAHGELDKWDWTLLAVLLPWLMVLHPEGWVLSIIFVISFVGQRIIFREGPLGRDHFIVLLAPLFIVICYSLLLSWELIPQIHFSSIMLAESGVVGFQWHFAQGLSKLFKDLSTLNPLPITVAFLVGLPFVLRSKKGQIVGLQLLGFLLLSVALYVIDNPHGPRFFHFFRPFMYVTIGLGAIAFFNIINHKSSKMTLALRSLVAIVCLGVFYIGLRDARAVHRFAGQHKNFQYNQRDFSQKVGSQLINQYVLYDDQTSVHYLVANTQMNFIPVPLEFWKNEKFPSSVKNKMILGENVFFIADMKDLKSGDPIEYFENLQVSLAPIYVDDFWGVYSLKSEEL
jgi:hypothetical protein